jgi:hypothetical protein
MMGQLNRDQRQFFYSFNLDEAVRTIITCSINARLRTGIA